METFLLAITVASLLVAFVMSVAVWRLHRDDRARSSARVAALAAAAADPTPVEPARTPADVGHELPRSSEPRAPWPPVRVTGTSVAPRSSSVTAPAVARASDLVLNERATSDRVPRIEAAARHADVGDDFLGSATLAPASGGQRGLALAAAVLFVIVTGGGYWAVYGDRHSANEAAAAATASPLELVSLRHERSGSRLAVSGLVRNPAAGTPRERLAAVVFLFDQQGGLVRSARSEVDYTRLGPGDESPFVISVDAPPSVARYRVSFRTESGLVPHVDRRGDEPVAPNALSSGGAARR